MIAQCALLIQLQRPISYAALSSSCAAPFGHDFTLARWAFESKGEELTAESMATSSIQA
jgi:hypothetical protein